MQILARVFVSLSMIVLGTAALIAMARLFRLNRQMDELARKEREQGAGAQGKAISGKCK